MQCHPSRSWRHWKIPCQRGGSQGGGHIRRVLSQIRHVSTRRPVWDPGRDPGEEGNECRCSTAGKRPGGHFSDRRRGAVCARDPRDDWLGVLEGLGVPAKVVQLARYRAHNHPESGICLVLWVKHISLPIEKYFISDLV